MFEVVAHKIYIMTHVLNHLKLEANSKRGPPTSNIVHILNADRCIRIFFFSLFCNISLCDF